jgi:transcriptional regulator GlxA family with amidase domain
MNPTTDTIEARFAQLQKLHVGILVFPEVEVLDFAGPFEVFSVASRIAKSEIGVDAPFQVALVGAHAGVIQARHGLGIVPHHSFADAPALDLLIVAGGIVTQPLGDPATLDWVRAQHAGAALTASVCTGAFVLAKAGLLGELAVTTHWDDIAELRRDYPALTVRDNVPYVDNGRIVTSAGISAGIGMSLHLVARILGEPMALATARRMEYDWSPNSL